jgi:hypothetical protein
VSGPTSSTVGDNSNGLSAPAVNGGQTGVNPSAPTPATGQLARAGTQAPGAPAPQLASAGASALPAGTATHTPIRIGFMYTNNDAAASAGVNNNQSVTADRVMKALVASYNSAGGIAGRKVVAYYQVIHSSSNNFEGDLAASCAAFTQDDHVAVVIETVGLYSENFERCLAKAQVPVFSDLAPDRQDAQEFPLLVTPDDLLADTRVAEVVQQLTASRFLTPAHKIGVVVENCPVDNRVFANSLQPALARARLHLAATANPQCFSAISDLGTIAAQLGNAVVSFRSSGVDRVMFVSIGEEGTLTFEFMLAASQQDWYPGYAMSSMSLATTVAAQSGIKPQEFANAHGIGWSPPADTADLRQAPRSSSANDCLARIGKQGVRPTTGNDLYTSWIVCDEFSLLDAALRQSNGDATGSPLLRGVAQASASHWVSALNVDGSARPWDNGRLEPAEFRYFGWVASKNAFAYTSGRMRF